MATAGSGSAGPARRGWLSCRATSRARPTRFMPLSDTEAFLSLALHAVNLLPHGAAGSAALGRVVAQSDCYALTMSDLDEACALVQGLVEGTTPPAVALGRAARAR